MNEVLFDNIKSLCDKKGISISKLEKECGFGQGTIYKWKTVSPVLVNLQKVADYFKITIDKMVKKSVN
jgi:transcriptional regulator with XRE-family HTH domain